MIGGAGQIPEFFPIPTTQANAPVSNRPRPQAQPNLQAQPAAQPQETDQVVLSPQARQIVHFVQQVQAQPEVRPDVVARIQATLGQTNNNPAQNAKIAEKLLTEI